MPAPLAALVHRLLAKQTANRPDSATAVAEELEELARSHEWTWHFEDEDEASRDQPLPDSTHGRWLSTVALKTTVAARARR